MLMETGDGCDRKRRKCVCVCVVFVLPSVESDKGFREEIQKPFELILHIQTHEPNLQRDTNTQEDWVSGLSRRTDQRISPASQTERKKRGPDGWVWTLFCCCERLKETEGRKGGKMTNQLHGWTHYEKSTRRRNALLSNSDAYKQDNNPLG